MKISAKYSHRTGVKTLIVTAADGSVLPGADVTVRQTKHSFLFGCSESSTLPYLNGEMNGEEAARAEKRYAKMFDIFNFVTLPFYWGRYEPESGKPDSARMLKAAEWLTKHGCRIKGHPLCWHTVCAPWLMELSNADILETLHRRIEREVTAFAGLVDIWDVINEVVIMPVFDKYDNAITRICKELGRFRLTREVFAEARKANPGATLLINDFVYSDAYAILIEGLLDMGVPIDAIGIQTHMHQGYWGPEKTMRVIERFSKFGLPLHFTENTIVSGDIMPPDIVDLNDFKPDSWPSTPEGEERQARETVTHYETLFASPLVESITWWSFSDGLWLGAPAGLVSRESDAKPAYNGIKRLIKDEWWLSEEQHISNEKGEITVTGCYGDYIAEYNGNTINFTIDKN